MKQQVCDLAVIWISCINQLRSNHLNWAYSRAKQAFEAIEKSITLPPSWPIHPQNEKTQSKAPLWFDNGSIGRQIGSRIDVNRTDHGGEKEKRKRKQQQKWEEKKRTREKGNLLIEMCQEQKQNCEEKTANHTKSSTWINLIAENDEYGETADKSKRGKSHARISVRQYYQLVNIDLVVRNNATNQIWCDHKRIWSSGLHSKQIV